MIEINLLPEDQRKREAINMNLPDIPVMPILKVALLVFAGLQILMTLFAFYQRFEVAMVGVEVASLKKELAQSLKQKAEADLINTRLNQIARMTHRKFYWSSLLNSLSHSMTRGVWLREFSQMDLNLAIAATPGKENPASSTPAGEKIRCLRLDGSAMGQGQETAYIGKFVKELKENSLFSEFFSQIELSNINQRKIKDVDVYDFELVCVFKKEMA